jgi:hypothetical protein
MTVVVGNPTLWLKSIVPARLTFRSDVNAMLVAFVGCALLMLSVMLQSLELVMMMNAKWSM